MKRIQNSLYAFAGIGMLIGIITFVTQTRIDGQESSGPTKPVLVVNEASNPVPVTGTITGNVTLAGSPNVNVVNTPTVRIDPAGNNVQFAPRGTVLLFDSGVYTDTGRRLFGPINIAPYSKIKISVTNVTPTPGQEMFVNTWVAPAGEPFGANTNFRLDHTQVDESSHSNKVYEAAGGVLYIDVFLGDDPNTVRVSVWGT